MKYNELVVGKHYYVPNLGIRILCENGNIYDEKGILQSLEPYKSDTYEGVEFIELDSCYISDKVPIIYLDKDNKFIKVDDNVTIKNSITFKDIKLGDSFLYNDKLYIKVGVSEDYLCYGLKNNNLFLISENDLVETVPF